MVGVRDGCTMLRKDKGPQGSSGAGDSGINKARMTELLTGRRHELRLTIRQVAAKATASIATIHKLENGTITVQLDIVLRVLHVLQISPKEFFSEISSVDGDAGPGFESLLAGRIRKDLPSLLDFMANELRRDRTKL